MTASGDPERAAPVLARSITVSRFAGVTPEEAYTVDGLGPGVTLVTGPNGCGKTTTARALQTLIWPDDPLDGFPGLRAEFRQGEVEWILETRGRRVEAARDGLPRAHPAWASPDTRGRYHWSLRNLLGDSDTELARRIAAEMAGGVDFDLLAAKRGFDKPPSRPAKLRERYQEAERKVREAIDIQRDLSREAGELDRLEAERTREEATARRLPLIDDARDLRALESEWKQVADRLAQAPPHMDRLRGDDADQLAEWLERRDTLTEEIRGLKLRREQLGAGEPDWATFSPEQFRETRSRLDTLRKRLESAETAVVSAEKTLSERETRERELRGRLRIGPGAVSDLSATYETPELRTWIERTLRRKTLNEEVARLERGLERQPEEDAADPEKLRDARRDLATWLNAAAPPAPLPRLPFLFATLLLFGLILWLVLSRGFPAWWLALALPPVALQLWMEKQTRRNRLLDLESRYPTGVPAPEVWTVDDVRATLRRLDEAEDAARRRRFREQDKERLSVARAELATLDAELADATEHLKSLGLEAGPDPLWTAHFLEDMQSWRRLRDDTAVAETGVREAEEAHAGAVRALEALLAEWSVAGDRDPAASAAELEERMEREMQRRRDLEELNVRRGHAEERLKEVNQHIGALGERLGLDQPDLQTVRHRVERLEEWRRDFRRSETLEARRSELRNKLESESDLLEATVEELDRLAEAGRRAGEREAELRDRISRLRQRIEDSSRGRRVHEAREELESRRRDLREDREAALRVSTGREVLDWLRESCRARERPEVLEAANRHLLRFTSGGLKLALSLENGEEAFHAAREGRAARPLDQLSSGERTQLLMAVRLAFLDLHERAALPLFVDEALGTSDDERAGRIMEALLRIAATGRQVLYFTAQQDEVTKWRLAADEAGAELRVIDLGRLRRREAAATLPPLPAREPERIDTARRDGESLRDWAERLQVPGWTPRRPVEDIHLWHLLSDDESALVTLLAHGVDTWGALNAFVDAGAADNLADDTTLATLRRRIRALESLGKAWRIGRPPPVPESEIADSGAVSDTFLPQVINLLRKVEGDAAALLRGLEEKQVPGFRQQKIDDLRGHLREKGYLVDEQPLSGAALRARAYADTQDLDLSPAEWDHLLLLAPTEPEPPAT